MKQLPNSSNRPSAYALLLTILFVAALASPISLLLLGIQWNYIEGENRAQAIALSLPKTGDEAIAFPTRANEWFNDRFPLRKPLVEANGSWALMLGESPNSGVFIGRQKWLFYREGTDALFSRFEVPISTIKSFEQMLLERATWLKSRGIAYLFVIVPDKHTIYPENLPLILSNQSGKYATFREQLLAGLSPEARALCLDLTPALKSAKGKSDLFLRADTHWNFYGALAAQRAIVEHLKPSYPQLRELTAEDFSLAIETRAGDLSNLILQPERFKDHHVIPVARGLKGIPENPDQPWQELAVHRYAQANSTLPRAVIFGDSFLTALRPLLAETFGALSIQVNSGEKTVSTEFVLTEVESMKPNIVINESIERLLPKQILHNAPEVQASPKLGRQ